MDTRFAQSLLTVIEEGSLAAAARRQGLTAAALAQRMQALERMFGTRLIERVGQTVRPTAAAQRMVPRLQRIVEDTRRLTSDLDASGLSGPYRLSSIATALADHATNIVSHLADRAPECALTITPGDSRSLLRSLEADEIDAAIVVRPPSGGPKSIQLTPIAAQPFVMVASDQADSPEGLILYDRSTCCGRLAWKWIANAIPNVKIVCEMDDPQSIAVLAASGLGRAVLPKWRALEDISGLQATQIDDAPCREVVLATKGGPSAIDHLVVEATKR